MNRVSYDKWKMKQGKWIDDLQQVVRQKEHHKQKVLEVLNSMFTIHKQISKMVSDQVL